jgi:transposase
MLNGLSHPIFISISPVDMRKSFDGLAAIVKNSFHKNPLDGTIFVFINRVADRLKMLRWEGDGYVLWYKRLEAGRFRIPVSFTTDGKPVVLISAAQLAMILEGIEPIVIKQRKRFSLNTS